MRMTLGFTLLVDSPKVVMVLLLCLQQGFMASSCGSLQCTQCMALGFNSCTEGLTVTCPMGQVCTSMYQQSTVDGKTSEFLYRSCGPTSHCDKAGSLSIVNKNVRMGITCCFTDNCSSPLPSLPPASTRRNGKVCPMCSDSNEACRGTKTMDCVGNENQCLLQVTRLQDSPDNVESFRGCSTKSICEIRNQNMSIGILSMESKYLCNGEASVMSQGFGASIVLTLVLLVLLN
ncbi:uncharacterized protein RB166_012249 [Leptodactylus fuscus]